MAGKREPAGKPFRHELKYIISEGEHQLLATRLRACLRQDYYASLNGGEYFIRSLYFDDPYDSAVSDKIDGTGSRDKFRIRIYNLSDSAIKLERKHKEGSSSKRTAFPSAGRNATRSSTGSGVPQTQAGTVAMQIYGIFKSNYIRPKVLVDYVREPYVFPAEEVRITFDRDVRTAMRVTDLFNPHLATYPVWELKNCMILEVKFNNSLPMYVQELLTVNAAQHTAASKYVFCRQYEF
jgi:hypothetical protein